MVVSSQDRGVVADVYGLTVADAHEFFADGILVSNCDSLRYGVLRGPRGPARSMSPALVPGSVPAGETGGLWA